jgi:phosphoserine phosphatase
LSIKDLDKIASEITLIEGSKEVIEELTKNNVKLYILSGSIKYIIKKILGDLYFHFDGIKANDLSFDQNGYFKTITETLYDFEGKAHFIDQVIKENGISRVEAFFVGNSLNDEWAHESGAITLCINPSMTNPDHPIQWTHSIRNLTNLNQIFKYLTF